MSATTAEEAVIVLNPKSGTGDHVEDVRRRADLEGFEVRKTEREGHGIELAREAAEAGVSTVVAAGGDGTLNEVIAGVADANALDDVTVAVVPTGTGNNFAGNVGLTDVDDAFHAILDGERRRVDLGWANDRPFVNSCVGGITADASESTTPEQKSRLGVLAYLVTTLESVANYDERELTVSVDDPEGGETAWTGDAIAVLAGNGRRFTERGSTQGNIEDGLLEVSVVEDVPAVDLLREAVFEELLTEDDEVARYFETPSLEIEVRDGEPMTFSLDGEILEERTLTLETDPQALELVVGDGYDPTPERP